MILLFGLRPHRNLGLVFQLFKMSLGYLNLYPELFSEMGNSLDRGLSGGDIFKLFVILAVLVKYFLVDCKCCNLIGYSTRYLFIIR